MDVLLCVDVIIARLAEKDNLLYFTKLLALFHTVWSFII